MTPDEVKPMTEQQQQPADDLPETISPAPGILIADHFRESFGYAVKRSGGTKDWIITFTLSGSGSYRIGDYRLVCVPGDIVILKPGTPHRYAAEPAGWRFVWSHFLPEPRWAGLLQLPEPHPGLIHLSIESAAVRSRLERTFDRLIHETKDEMPLKDQLAINAMEEIVLLVAGEHRRDGSQALDPRVEEVLRLLTERLSEPHTVEELARHVALSPSRLAHLFKAQVGDAVLETLLKTRLRHAARLLEHTSRLVSEIAADVGFGSPYYFTKQFTSFFGCSPTVYRERKQ
ncbi:helix-turn-helix domain-containing protein [Paenibacillus cymbidii]|uniref:helix-turn-helix domain-containing protein n=1 Tax=Paenibacillus cymbidii TaxID=1639034 RepID=UPI001081C155|nr:helix-turn-helix domain-containing protein [Paenibacillus cymbidii]